jgi:hypothetical protein
MKTFQRHIFRADASFIDKTALKNSSRSSELDANKIQDFTRPQLKHGYILSKYAAMLTVPSTYILSSAKAKKNSPFKKHTKC